jgi:hypothetical protein
MNAIHYIGFDVPTRAANDLCSALAYPVSASSGETRSI